MLLTYQDLKETWPKVVARWYEVANSLDAVCNLFFSTRYARAFLEPTFLNLVQAVEVYDRRRHPNQSIPEEQHLERLSAVVGAAPEEHREWLRDRLAWSNEPSLRTRLKRTLGPVEIVVRPMVESVPWLIDRVVDTRNYYTHYDPSLEARAARGADLVHLNDLLGVVIESLFLVELGLSATHVASLLAIKPHYLHLVESMNASRLAPTGEGSRDYPN
jgi:hypothetical protein